VTQDRRVTVLTRGPTQPVLSEGSRLSWAMPSSVNEGLGYGRLRPTGYKVMWCCRHMSHNGPVPGVHVMLLVNAHPSSRTRNPRTGFATVKAASRRLRRWPRRPALTAAAAGALTQVAVGMKKRPMVEPRNGDEGAQPSCHDNIICWHPSPLDIPNPIQGVRV
jgi:hypothetical protein